MQMTLTELLLREKAKLAGIADASKNNIDEMADRVKCVVSEEMTELKMQEQSRELESLQSWDDNFMSATAEIYGPLAAGHGMSRPDGVDRIDAVFEMPSVVVGLVKMYARPSPLMENAATARVAAGLLTAAIFSHIMVGSQTSFAPIGAGTTL